MSTKTINKMFDLFGRVAIVTGGAGMLGSQYADVLAEAGANVVIADVDYEKAQKIKKTINHHKWRKNNV